MAFAEFFRRAQRLVANNSPLILTGIGVAGSLTTAYLAGRASFKAAQIIERETLHPERTEKMSCGPIPELEFREKFELVWMLYIPAAGTAVITVSAIIFANRIGTRRAAAVAAAYAITERAFDEYREKIIEKIGARKEETARDEIAQERVNRDPVGSSEVIIIGTGSVLCYDAFAGRYFNSDMESLRRAVNDTNHQILNDYYASLSDFYERVGLPPTKVSEEMGWNSDKLLELKYSTVLSEDNKPCISIDFQVVPIRHYNRVQ